jgi:hypothetical protein
MSRLSALLDSASVPLSSIPRTEPSSTSDLHSHDGIQAFSAPPPRVDRENATGPGQQQQHERDPLGALAREFGVEAQLVQALAERLSALY